MTRTFRAAIAALIAALSVAAMIDAAPARATIGPMEASLQIFQGVRWCAQDQDYVSVVGLVRMSYSEAVQALNYDHYSPRIIIRLWGDDPFSDNLLHSTTAYGATFRTQPDGLYFEKQYCVSGNSLNEDQSWTDNRDEIYAGVHLVNSRTGATIRSGETNRWYDYF